jgi:hypothetical protein
VIPGASTGSGSLDITADSPVEGSPVALSGVGVPIPPDTDHDGIADDLDNCLMVPNPTQVDSDQDGYGNICDGDLNNNGVVNTQDFGILRTHLGAVSTAPGYDIADLNANGAVNTQDFGIFRNLLGSAPGPSGLSCAGTAPCPPEPAAPAGQTD